MNQAPSIALKAQQHAPVKITRVESLDAEADGDDLTIEAEIKGASKERKLKYNKNAHNVTWSVQRLVAPDEPVQIGFELREFDVGPESGVVTSGWGASPCGYHTDPPYGPWQYPPCPDVNTKLGLGGGKLTVDLATGKISGAAAGQVGQTLTLSGASSPRGKIKVVVTVD